MCIRDRVKWLISKQDRESGHLGLDAPIDPERAHAIATLVLCEAYRIDKSILLKGKVQRALAHITGVRNGKETWSRDPVPGTGLAAWEMGWTLLALGAARSARLELSEDVPVDCSAMIAQMILDPEESQEAVFERYADLMLSRLQASELSLIHI